MPNQYAVSVTGIVECLFLIPSAAPDTEHVHVGITRGPYDGVEPLTRHQCWSGIKRNPVRALAEHGSSVHADSKLLASHGRVVSDLNGPETDSAGERLPLWTTYADYDVI